MNQVQMTPFVFSNYTDYLKAVRLHYGERKKKISLQMWAQRLGYKTARSLELIISGDRFPSAELIYKLSKDLKLKVNEQKYFELMVRREKLLLNKKPVHDIEIEMNHLRPARFEARYIDNEIFQRVSEWYPIVIRQLALTPGFKKDINWIVKRLKSKFTALQAAAALAEWESLAFDRRSLYTNDDVPSQAVRTFHKKMLSKAIEAIDEIDVNQREYISLTFRSNKKKLLAMKQALRQVRDQFSEESKDGEDTEVFQLCFALFPHTPMK